MNQLHVCSKLLGATLVFDDLRRIVLAVWMEASSSPHYRPTFNVLCMEQKTGRLHKMELPSQDWNLLLEEDK